MDAILVGLFGFVSVALGGYITSRAATEQHNRESGERQLAAKLERLERMVFLAWQCRDESINLAAKIGGAKFPRSGESPALVQLQVLVSLHEPSLEELHTELCRNHEALLAKARELGNDFSMGDERLNEACDAMTKVTYTFTDAAVALK